MLPFFVNPFSVFDEDFDKEDFLQQNGYSDSDQFCRLWEDRMTKAMLGSENFPSYDEMPVSESYELKNSDELSDLIAYGWDCSSEKTAEEKSHYFQTEKLNKKRGRQSKKGNKETHTSADFDNITSKVQISFLSFLIALLNNAVSALKLDTNIKFANFDYKIKRNVKKELRNALKKYSVEDLLIKFEISSKYTRVTKDTNSKNIGQLKNHPWFNQIFKMKYTDLFYYYYNNELPCQNLLTQEKISAFSKKKMKTFSDLLEKNKKLKEEMIKYTEMEYPTDNGEFESD